MARQMTNAVVSSSCVCRQVTQGNGPYILKPLLFFFRVMHALILGCVSFALKEYNYG